MSVRTAHKFCDRKEEDFPLCVKFVRTRCTSKMYALDFWATWAACDGRYVGHGVSSVQ